MVKSFFNQVPKKGFALLVAGQFATRLQEFGLWDSYLDGSWQAMPSIKTFLMCYFIIFGHPVSFASNWLSSMDVFFQKRNERWAPCSESQTIWHVTSYPWSLRRSKHGECKLHTPAKVIHLKYYKQLKKKMLNSAVWADKNGLVPGRRACIFSFLSWTYSI